MNKLFFVFLLLYSMTCNALHYRHISVEDGLSSRRVYSIQKDYKGFMWFLTREGVDQYDGSEFKHYNLGLDENDISSLGDLNWLYVGQKGELWPIGKKGRIFKYDPLNDTFNVAYQLPPQNSDNPVPISFSFIDNTNTIWLCARHTIYLYNDDNQTSSTIGHQLGTITQVAQHDQTRFFVGTETGLYYTEYEDDQLKIVPVESLNNPSLRINELYLDKQNERLYIGTFQRGVYVFDIRNKTFNKIQIGISDMRVTRIRPLNEEEILVATDGAGVYKMNTKTHATQPYIVTNYRDNSMINSNYVYDIFIDSENRIWLANHPTGISIRDDRYWEYRWIRHFSGNTQSLINDRVNAVIEDSDGDLWFATSNGISLYYSQTDTWKSFLSSYNIPTQQNTHTFLSLCEVDPGLIYVAGYGSTIYMINKKSMTVSPFPIHSYRCDSVRPDKYIKAIQKDSQGHIWIGGHYNLKEINDKTKEIRLFPQLRNITTILECNENSMWIGTNKGLYLLDKQSGEAKKINTPTDPTYIYSLCQPHEDLLYVGTFGSGLLVYNLQTETLKHFHKNNNALLSNNVYTILNDYQGNIVFSSEFGLTRFYPKDSDFRNWTKEQGLTTNHFYSNSGVLTQNNKFIFGGSDGAIEFDKNMKWPREYSSKMILSDFKIFYESVYPGNDNSPLEKNIDDTETLRLDYNQNIFSLKISSINYDYPSNVLYSWKLEGFYNNWSKPGRENVIRFTNLGPGKYTLHIRAISNENRQILEERKMEVIIAQPFWRSIWALILYILLSTLTVIGISRLIYLRKQRKMADEKFQFFINTAHDIRTPLTLIKAPLEEVMEKEPLSETGTKNMDTALRNVNVLLRLTTNLINFERMDLYSSNLYIAEYELNTFVKEIIQSFNSFAEVRKIKLGYESNFRHLNVWFDKDKMESAFKNVIANALKYTPKGGSVNVYATETINHWEIEIKDTGIGIPAGEQKKVFKTEFRGSNAINSEMSGSGIGMVLVAKQVGYHKGRITMSSVEHQGTSIKMIFPKGYGHYNKTHISTVEHPQNRPQPPVIDENMTATFESASKRKRPKSGQRILVVEDNDELRGFLQETLSEEYNVQACENGHEALIIVKEFAPDLVISDIMMSGMRGDELCGKLKNNLETSHIPIILLTALNDERHIVKGLYAGADEYIIKPFNICVLKAIIANILTNRAILRFKYANLEIEQTAEEACSNCSTGIDWKFIGELRAKVETHMEDPHFNIDQLAADMNMSRTSLYNKIKALTDLTPSDYVRNVRLTKAAELLLEGNLNVTEVSEKTGFSDAKYFREVFKKHFDVSPSKYSGK